MSHQIGLKKVFFILLSVIYLASSAGATVQLHYCMDKLVGIGMNESENDICGSCGMEKQDGCCKDQSKQIKIADDQKPPPKFFLNTIVTEEIDHVDYNNYILFYQLKGLYAQPRTNGPPIGGIELYKYLRVFRI